MPTKIRRNQTQSRPNPGEHHGEATVTPTKKRMCRTSRQEPKQLSRATSQLFRFTRQHPRETLKDQKNKTRQWNNNDTTSQRHEDTKTRQRDEQKTTTTTDDKSTKRYNNTPTHQHHNTTELFFQPPGQVQSQEHLFLSLSARHPSACQWSCLMFRFHETHAASVQPVCDARGLAFFHVHLISPAVYGLGAQPSDTHGRLGCQRHACDPAGRRIQPQMWLRSEAKLHVLRYRFVPLGVALVSSVVGGAPWHRSSVKPQSRNLRVCSVCCACFANFRQL